MVYKVGLYHHFICPALWALWGQSEVPRSTDEQESILDWKLYAALSEYLEQELMFEFSESKPLFSYYTLFPLSTHTNTLNKLLMPSHKNNIDFNLPRKAMEKLFPVQESTGCSLQGPLLPLCLCTGARRCLALTQSKPAIWSGPWWGVGVSRCTIGLGLCFRKGLKFRHFMLSTNELHLFSQWYTNRMKELTCFI